MRKNPIKIFQPICPALTLFSPSKYKTHCFVLWFQRCSLLQFCITWFYGRSDNTLVDTLTVLFTDLLLGRLHEQFVSNVYCILAPWKKNRLSCFSANFYHDAAPFKPKSRRFQCQPGLDPGSSLRKLLKILWIPAFAEMNQRFPDRLDNFNDLRELTTVELYCTRGYYSELKN